jgi:Flp pilus assembly protein TadG
MKKQRGQAVVEFALVLPFFMMLLFFILVSGFLFADYMTLSNVARSSAREAALGGDRATIVQKYKDNTHLLSGNNSLYRWDGGITFTDGDIDNSIKATITTSLNTSFPGVGVVNYFSTLPSTYNIEYTMHNESSSTE